MVRTFYIETFGCQMNKLDSEMLATVLGSAGLKPAPTAADAGVVIYNTCSVRQQAEDRVMSHLGRWRGRAETDPDFILGVVGCVAQRMGGDIVKKFPYVRLVCGTRAFLNVPDYISKISDTGRSVVDLGETRFRFERDPALRPELHHAYVSIMRGCSNFCSYCIVPYVRGPEVSRPVAAITDEVKQLADSGVAEITLLGQNVNAYGRHDGGTEGSRGGLPRLLGELNGVEGLKRIRFVTSHPKDMRRDILEAVAENEKVCEHIHMPVQSGSDRILKAMNRGYSRRYYLEILETAHRIVPDVAFSSDFIVGFPGETDGDFEDTLSLLRTAGFQQIYNFRYSPRAGTGGADLPDDVPDPVKRQRQQQLLAVQERVDIERRRGLIGATLEVMCTGVNPGHQHEGRLIGRSRHNDIVVFGGRADTDAGAVCEVTIENATALTLFGRQLREIAGNA